MNRRAGIVIALGIALIAIGFIVAKGDDDKQAFMDLLRKRKPDEKRRVTDEEDLFG